MSGCNCNRVVLKGDKGDTGPQGPQGPQGSFGYNVYTALISQSGTNPPEVTSNGTGAGTPLMNTLGGSPTFSYTSTGVYKATLPSGFLASKTFLIITSSDGTIVGGSRLNDDELELYSKNATGTLADSQWTDVSFRIEVYP